MHESGLRLQISTAYPKGELRSDRVSGALSNESHWHAKVLCYTVGTQLTESNPMSNEQDLREELVSVYFRHVAEVPWRGYVVAPR